MAGIAWRAGVVDRSDFGARRRATSVLRRASGLLAVAALVAGWELLARTVFAGRYTLAPPSDVVRELRDNWPLYRRSIAATGWVAVRGFVIGNAVAFALAAVAVALPRLERAITSVVLAAYCIPMIALAPIIGVLLDGDRARVALASFAVVFNTLVATVLGLRAADPGAVDLVRVLGGSSRTVLVHVRLRAALPSVLAGLRVAAPAAVLGATVAEFLGADRGLGVLIVDALTGLDPTRVWTVATISTLVAGAGYVAIGLVDRRVNSWTTRQTFAAPARHAPVRRSPARRVGATAVAAVLTAAGLLAVWALLVEISGLSSFFAKGPLDVWRALTDGPRAATDRDLLFGGLGTTLFDAGGGYLLGLVGGFLLAVVFVLVPAVERLVLPVAITLRSIPILATVPVVMLLLGRGQLSTFVIVGVMSFFPTLVNTTVGMRSPRAEVVELLQIYDCSARTILWRARVPAALPALFASARLALPASVLGAVVVEWLATGTGLGNTILAGVYNVRYVMLWASAALLCAVTMTAYALLAALERAVLRVFAPEQIGR